MSPAQVRGLNSCRLRAKAKRCDVSTFPWKTTTTQAMTHGPLTYKLSCTRLRPVSAVHFEDLCCRVWIRRLKIPGGPHEHLALRPGLSNMKVMNKSCLAGFSVGSLCFLCWFNFQFIFLWVVFIESLQRFIISFNYLLSTDTVESMRSTWCILIWNGAAFLRRN